MRPLRQSLALCQMLRPGIGLRLGMEPGGTSPPPPTPQVAIPLFDPPAGNYSGTQSVEITTTTAGAEIRYTTDGSAPTESHGTVYSGPVSVSSNTTLRAIGYLVGYLDSDIASGDYVIGPAIIQAVVSQVLGTPRNDFSGWVGFRFTIGASSITLKSLGRWCKAGNVQNHTVVIVPNGGTVEAPIATVVINGASASDDYAFADIADANLSSGATYFIMSHEFDGGDLWYDFDTTIITTLDVTDDRGSYCVAGSPISVGVPGTAFVTPNFKYSL